MATIIIFEVMFGHVIIPSLFPMATEHSLSHIYMATNRGRERASCGLFFLLIIPPPPTFNPTRGDKENERFSSSENTSLFSKKTSHIFFSSRIRISPIFYTPETRVFARSFCSMREMNSKRCHFDPRNHSLINPFPEHNRSEHGVTVVKEGGEEGQRMKLMFFCQCEDRAYSMLNNRLD